MSYRDSTRWKINSDGTARKPGVDFGNGSKPIKVWHRTETHIVFKVPAGKHWVGRGMAQASHPGEYIVCEYVADQDHEGYILTDVLFRMAVSEKGAAVNW
jgi:hypothetical protein